MRRLLPLLTALALAVPAVSLAQVLSTYATGTTSAQGLAFDGSGNLYVTNSSTLYKVPPGGGAASVFVNTGLVDAWGVVCDAAGNVFVADRGSAAVANSGLIHKITPAGVRTTFKSGLPAPFGIAMDAAGNLYTGAYNAQKVLKITPAGVVSDYATGVGVVGNQTYQLEFDAAGNLYAGNENRIVRIGPGGAPVTQVVGGLLQAMGFIRWMGDNFIVSTFGFGRLLYASPTRGNPAIRMTSITLVNQCTDGVMVEGARVNQPALMTLYNNFVYVADQGCNKVRRFDVGTIDPVQRRSWGAVKSIYR